MPSNRRSTYEEKNEMAAAFAGTAVLFACSAIFLCHGGIVTNSSNAFIALVTLAAFSMFISLLYMCDMYSTNNAAANNTQPIPTT